MEAARTEQLTHQQVDSIGESIAEHAAHLDAATHRLLADIRTFDAAGGWYRQGARSCADWLAWRVGWSSNTAREHVRVANRLGELPLIDDALRRGEVSYCKVRAMTRVATAQNEALLLEDARYTTGSQLEQICRKYAVVRSREGATPIEDERRRTVTRRDLDDGMVAINAVLHADEAAIVWEALTRIARERAIAERPPGPPESTRPPITAETPRPPTIEYAQSSRRFSRVDAFVQLATDVVRGNRPDRSPVELIVSVSAETLLSPSADGVGVTGAGCCLPADVVRRLDCDAGLVLVVEDEDGKPVATGRKARTFSPAMRRALFQRDRTCRFPGCNSCIGLDGHHAKPWAEGGETTLRNGLLLCKFHHRFMHEYGYRVDMDERHQPTFYDPHGRVIPAVPPPSDTAERGFELLRAANDPLAITASTNLPMWDGAAVHYDLVIDDLCRADRLGRPADTADVSAETQFS
jgi:hypothetical protein